MSTTTRRWFTAATVAAVVAGGIPAIAAGPAAAASQTVTITASGFVPKDVSIRLGETVTLVNSDAVVHQIEFKPTTGVSCATGTLLVQPGQSEACTFASAGNFSFTDPNKKGNTYRGTVTVAAPPTVAGSITLASSKALVIYGSKVTLSGKVSPAKGGVSVDILARPYPETTFAKAATVVSSADGSYAYAVPPQLRTEYRAQFVDGGVKGESSVITVQVRPRVSLAVRSVRGRVATLRSAVVSTINYSGKPLLVQRRNSQGGWTTVKTVRMGEFSTRTFAVRAPGGTSRWRVYLQASQAGGGYVASYSPTRMVRR